MVEMQWRSSEAQQGGAERASLAWFASLVASLRRAFSVSSLPASASILPVASCSTSFLRLCSSCSACTDTCRQNDAEGVGAEVIDVGGQRRSVGLGIPARLQGRLPLLGALVR